jgi:hypothetical protein
MSEDRLLSEMRAVSASMVLALASAEHKDWAAEELDES